MDNSELLVLYGFLFGVGLYSAETLISFIVGVFTQRAIMKNIQNQPPFNHD